MSVVQGVSFTADDNLKWAINSPIKAEVNPKQTVDDKKTLKTVAYASSAIALASLGIAAVSIRNSRGLKKVVNSLKSNSDGLGAKVDSLAENMKGLAENIESTNKLSEEIDSLKKWYDGWIKDVENRADRALVIRAAENSIGVRNLGEIDGKMLMMNLENDGSRIPLKPDVVEWLNKVTSRYVNNGLDHIPTKPLTKNSSVWSVTAESIPEKEGGLGEVPVQIAKNMTSELGIDNYIVRPMILIPGKASLQEVAGKYTYSYGDNFALEVTKIAEYNTKAFRNGRYEDHLVEVFTGFDPKQGHKRLMFKNDDYFTATGLYKDTPNISEPERFSFFAKAVYDFMKLKKSPKSITNYKIFDKFDEVKAPDAMILNDWHAGALAALLRLKAPVEAAAGELSKDASEAFKTLNMININHNLDYQGISWNRSSEMLNTLFDKYAFDIYENANTGFGYPNLAKVLTLDGNVNLANMAACLSNKMKPVSPTYAKEVAEQASRGHGMQHICKVRLNQGTLEGKSNGWDRAVNEVSKSRIETYNNMINKDKFILFKEAMKKITGLNEADKAKLDAILNGKTNGKENISFSEFEGSIAKLKKMNSPLINQVLRDLKKTGLTALRDYKPYTRENTIEEILYARKQDKAMLLNHINSMVAHNKTKQDGIFDIARANLTDLSKIKPEDLDDTIVFNMGVRFVSQKGVDIASEALKKLYRDWDKLYPGKPKPITIMGGVDAEGGNIRKIALELKDALGADGERIVYNDGYTSNPIWQSGSDFTLYPSHFEPDGAKMESLYKGTPVICTNVGGHADSVVDGVNGFLTERTVPEINSTGKDYLTEMGDDYLNAMKRAIKSYYEREPHTKMIQEAINSEQSWIIKDADDRIVGGALLSHLEDLGFNLKDFPQIKV